MAKRNRFPTKTVASYDESYHGKVLNIGYTQRVAGCADCHLGHNILSKKLLPLRHEPGQHEGRL